MPSCKHHTINRRRHLSNTLLTQHTVLSFPNPALLQPHFTSTVLIQVRLTISGAKLPILDYLYISHCLTLRETMKTTKIYLVRLLTLNVGYGASLAQPGYGSQQGYYDGGLQFNQQYGNPAQGMPQQETQGPVPYPMHQQVQPPMHRLGQSQHGSPGVAGGMTFTTSMAPVKQCQRTTKACDRCSNSKQKCDVNAGGDPFPCARYVTS